VGTNALPFLLDRIAYTERKPEKVLRSLLSRFQPRYASREFEVRLYAIGGFEALGPMASPAIPELERLLFEKSVPECALALAAIGSETIPILAKALTNANANIRAEAASGIGFLGTDAEPLTPTLIHLTKDKDRSVRISAILALKVGSNSSTVPRLIQLLEDPDELVRKLAAEVLGEIGKGADAAVPALEKTARDPSNYVSKQAQIAIQKIRSTAPVSNTDGPTNGIEQRRRKQGY
jgi:HEAT repeat protein